MRAAISRPIFLLKIFVKIKYNFWRRALGRKLAEILRNK
jgi:hypothetical protein